MTPTYEQLLAELQKNNLTFSDYDLALARENPAAGYGIMNAKLDYSKATTDAGRALASSAAERWRAQGGYSGGVDGSGYVPLQSMPTSFSFPAMDNQYQQTYDQKLQAVYDRKPFEYSPDTDPLYGYYKDAYNREGQRAMQQTLAEVSARTGGLASSYATTAAAQQQNYYAQQLADKIPDLYQMAYQQYADEFNRSLQDASLAGDRYNMELGRYNTDRNFAYQLYGDDWTRRQTAINDARDRVNALIAQGADAASIPRDLLLASGLTEQEIQQAITYRDLLAQGSGGGRGSGTPAAPTEIIGYNGRGKSLVAASAGNPELASAYLQQYWDSLDYVTKFNLLQNAGYDNDTANALARGDSKTGLTGSDFSAYVAANQNTQNGVPDGADPTVSNNNTGSWVEVNGKRWTWNEVLDKVNSGEFIEEYHPKDNSVTYRRNPNYTK